MPRSIASSQPLLRRPRPSASTSPSCRLASCQPRHAALTESGALAVAEELTAPERLELILDHIQIALNIPPNAHRPGGPHIDGHVQQRTDQVAPDSFTLLVGIFLSDETEARQRSALGVAGIAPRARSALPRTWRRTRSMETGGHITMLSDPPRLAAPTPVTGRRGDLLLAHFLLGHNTGPNLTTTTRRMLYYRLGCPTHRSRWAATFLDALTEYEPVRRAMME